MVGLLKAVTRLFDLLSTDALISVASIPALHMQSIRDTRVADQPYAQSSVARTKYAAHVFWCGGQESGR